jgi:hypothetical protein
VRRHSGLCSRADIATIGFAISLVTSASVALADCFLVFRLAIRHDFRNPERLLVNLDRLVLLSKRWVVGAESGRLTLTGVAVEKLTLSMFAEISSR